MSIMERVGNWRTAFFLWIGLPLIAVAGLVYGAQDLVPAWQAHSGGGTPGLFTAMREDCGKRSCTLYGEWETADGSTRKDVMLYDEPDGMGVGRTVDALDTGARNGVFATSGGYAYLLITGFTVAGGAAALGWIVMVVRAVRRRRERSAAKEDGRALSSIGH
ncbi:hypothetical protein [Catellatospora methionotrophica]|uniref:hypothetical protein n=1 Tax=Catellatospora methionotrophica TaxID=121620 RepID=UPI003406320A